MFYRVLCDGSANTVSIEGWRNVWPTTPGDAAAFKGLHTFYFPHINAPDENLPKVLASDHFW